MIKVVKIIKTCNMCPAQWDGVTDDNRQFYVRYRWGCLTVSIGEPGDASEYAAVVGRIVFNRQLGGPFAGSMDYQALCEHLMGIVELPAEESPWLSDDEVRREIAKAVNNER
jgi:hypothetical protein